MRYGVEMRNFNIYLNKRIEQNEGEAIFEKKMTEIFKN